MYFILKNHYQQYIEKEIRGIKSKTKWLWLLRIIKAIEKNRLFINYLFQCLIMDPLITHSIPGSIDWLMNDDVSFLRLRS